MVGLTACVFSSIHVFMSKTDLSTTQERLKWARELAGLSASRLAVLSGLSRTHVTTFENNPDRGLDLETAKRLSRTLGLQLEWLACTGGRPPLPEEVRAAANVATHYPLQRRSSPSRRRGGPQRPPVASPSGDVARQGT